MNRYLWLRQGSIRELMIVIETGFFPFTRSHRGPFFRRWLDGKAASGLDRILYEVLVKKNSMVTWIGALAASI